MSEILGLYIYIERRLKSSDFLDWNPTVYERSQKICLFVCL